MNSKNRENQKCFRCKKATMTWYPKEKILKCANCNFESDFQKSKPRLVNYTKEFGENGAMWILYIYENFLKSHKLTKMYENIPMNIFSMELIKKEKEPNGEISKINYKETKTEESLKDFKLFYGEKSEEMGSDKFYEFTSIHHPITSTLKNAWSLVNTKWDKIQKMKIKDNNLYNYNFNLVVDYFIESFAILVDRDSKLPPIFNPAGKPKDVKKDLVLNAKKFLFWSTRKDGDLKKKWDFEYWNTGFNDVLLVKWNINDFDNSLIGEIWSLRKYVDIEECPTFKHTFKKSEVESIFATIGIESFSDFIISKHKK